MLKSFFSKKRNIFILVFILVIISILVFYLIFIKNKTYNVFIELALPNDSYGEVIYSPGNKSSFNLYVGSYLNIDAFFSDNKKHNFNYVIEDTNVLEFENNVLVAKNVGKTNIYIVTKDNIKSNVISVSVVNKEGKNE